MKLSCKEYGTACGKLLALLTVASVAATLGLTACSAVADGDPVESDDDVPSGSVVRRSSSSQADSAGSSATDDSSSSVVDADSVLNGLVNFVDIPASILMHGTIEYSVSAFSIAETEVTQGMYAKVMGEIPQMDKVGDDVAVANLNWYDAVLFCNEVSKMAGLDTAYVYTSVGEDHFLDQLVIDYSANAVRLPTETEWEIAARAGTSSTYYWDVEVASGYAYYGQTKGPVAVAQYKPNAYGLYDMGGNVAEWVNDWYASYSVDNETNPVGPETGDYRVIRGGGWSDVVKSLASAYRDKKAPVYKSQMLGLRLVHSVGF